VTQNKQAIAGDGLNKSLAEEQADKDGKGTALAQHLEAEKDKFIRKHAISKEMADQIAQISLAKNQTRVSLPAKRDRDEDLGVEESLLEKSKKNKDKSKKRFKAH